MRLHCFSISCQKRSGATIPQTIEYNTTSSYLCSTLPSIVSPSFLVPWLILILTYFMIWKSFTLDIFCTSVWISIFKLFFLQDLWLEFRSNRDVLLQLFGWCYFSTKYFRIAWTSEDLRYLVCSDWIPISVKWGMNIIIHNNIIYLVIQIKWSKSYYLRFCSNPEEFGFLMRWEEFNFC